ncbi:MAG: hypothetical protein OXF46_10830, partial [Rhodobacteraceae bacterium]|nr:hypothetical protein [Paracoccaceae bacterium]
MTRHPEGNQVDKRSIELVRKAVSRVISNPKNSKAAKTAAGHGLARRRNNSTWKPKIHLPS